MESFDPYNKILSVINNDINKILTQQETEEINKITIKSGLGNNIVDQGHNLLITACRQDNYEFANYLLDHGANPDFIGIHGFPLFFAAEGGFVDIVNLLLQYNVNVNNSHHYICNRSTGLHIACVKKMLI